ncbi:hypothetical protein NIES4102_11410 [Chondrocystis sp. NIES-4102]|nr:hypothetical protein NIES4102_11410 [Chondrocystis sp. NIES-4102]
MSSDFELQFNEFLVQCDDKDVISFQSDRLVSISKFKGGVNKVIKDDAIPAIHSYIHRQLTLSSQTWFTDGEECEILRAGSSGWQKGKIKVNITLEFIPDTATENSSPLDDLRQEINNSNT